MFCLIEPQCLSGPYAMMTPAAKSLWLANIPEMKSFVSMAHDLPLLGAWMAPFPLLALLSAAFMAQDGAQRRDFGFLVSVAALLIATTLTVFRIKGFSCGIWLGRPLVAAWTLRLFARLKLTNLLARAVVLLTLAPLTLSLAASSIAHATVAPATADERVCFQIDSYAPLARLKTGNVATNILDYAPHVLALTSHSVMAAPYHRLSDAILAEYRAFASSSEDARRILVEAHVDYVATCGSRGPVGLGAAELQAGLWGSNWQGSRLACWCPVARTGLHDLSCGREAAGSHAPKPQHPARYLSHHFAAAVLAGPVVGLSADAGLDRCSGISGRSRFHQSLGWSPIRVRWQVVDVVRSCRLSDGGWRAGRPSDSLYCMELPALRAPFVLAAGAASIFLGIGDLDIGPVCGVRDAGPVRDQARNAMQRCSLAASSTQSAASAGFSLQY